MPSVFPASNRMDHTKSLQFHFFLLLAAVSLFLLFLILKPFLSALLFAVTLSVVFYPIHKRILGKLKNRETMAAVVSVLIVLLVILLPLIFIVTSVFQELVGLYGYITTPDTLEQLNKFSAVAKRYVGGFLPDSAGQELSGYFEIREYIGQGLLWIIDNISTLFSSFIKVFLHLFLMILALFYFFKDGSKLEKSFLSLSPLSPDYSRKVLEKIGNALNSVVKGRLMIGVLQGIVTALGFLVFSVPNPMLWATVAAVFSVLPAVGPMLVILPTAAYLYFSAGSLMAALGIIVWGIAAVLLLDEYLGSILIDRGMKIHPFLILLSILGGLIIFGPIGFLLGPVFLSLFFALLEIYPLIVKP